MKQRKGFTLIELLAVIVILAIIALIAVPQILGVIATARKGAAKDSALGYVDAVEKSIMLDMLNEKYYNGVGTVSGSTLTGVGDAALTVNYKGSAPKDGGQVNIINSAVAGAQLEFGEYTVLVDGNGNACIQGDTDCSIVPNLTTTAGGNSSSNTTPSVPTIATCPGCSFLYTTSTLTLGTDTAPAGVTNDYTTLNKNKFLGIITNSTTGVIERAFACGVEGTTAFCLEGKDTSKYASNVDIINGVYPGCNQTTSYSDARCLGSSVDAVVNSNGHVYMGDGNGSCHVNEYDNLYCF